MAEYIEKEAAKRDLDSAFAFHSYAGGMAASVIDKIPAADVRPVVYCAECKHNNACLTQAFVEDESRVLFDRNTFFCADGKR